ncbi:MAG: Rha family transcriptional regulator [Aeromonas molluscorum]
MNKHTKPVMNGQGLDVVRPQGYAVGAAAKSAAGIETPRTTLEPTHAPIAWFFVGTRPPFTWVLFAYPAIGILCVMVARAGQPSGWSVSKVADSLNPARATTMRLRPQVGSDNLSTLEAAIMATVPTPVTPEIRLVNGQAVTTSLALANYFNKRHDNVIAKIHSLDCSPEFRLLNFKETVYDRGNPSGGASIPTPCYQLTRDGFCFIAMGFTGRRAAEFKERYIAAFNAMERQGHARYLAAPDANVLAHSVSEARDFYQMIRMHWESEIYPSLKAVQSPLAYELYDRFEWMSYLLIAIAHQVESHQTAQVVQGGQHEKA